MDDIFIGGNGSNNNRNNNDDEQYGYGSDDIYVTPRRRSEEEDYFPPEPQYPRKKSSEQDYYSREPQRRPQPQRPQPPKRPKKKRSKLLNKLIAIVLVIAILFCAGVGMIYKTFSSVNYNKTGHKSNVFLDSADLSQSSSVKNILLIGVDRRNSDESSRSDTMLLLSIDSKHKKIKLTSFMRDSYVYIPEKQKYAKLNAACSYGGAQMVMDTIEYNFNIKIDHYMLVDFSMFRDIIDGLGGVSVEITEKEAKYMRDIVHLTNVQAGESIALNGKEALWYCRIRKLDSDFMRTQRQRKVMTALISKAKHTSPFSLYKLAGDILEQVETDMSPGVLTLLAVNGMLRYLRYDVEQGSIPAEGTWSNKTISGQAVLKLDLEENSKYLEDFIYGDN